MNEKSLKSYLATGDYEPSEDAVHFAGETDAPVDLAKHDAKYHPKGYNPDTDTCNLRQELDRQNKADNLSDYNKMWKRRDAERAEEREYVSAAKKRAAEEYAAVIAKYKNTPQWMKAPNGKDTNLSERQWLQVRTPSFKQWFGDWENDPKDASKVVDENGEPKVVYHGTKEKFYYEFDTNVDEKGHVKDWNNSPGSFFAGTREAARAYSGTESGILYPQDIDEKMVREREGIVEGFGILDKYGTLRHQYGSDCFAETREALLDEFPLEEGEKVVPAYHTDYSTQCFPSIEALVKDERENNFEAYMDDKGGIYECFLNIRDPQVYDAHEDNWDAITTEYRVDINDGDDVEFFETEEEAIEYCNSHGLDPEEAVTPEQMSTNEIAKAVIDMGLDGAIIKNVTDSGGEWDYGWSFDDFIVFKSENIKSATHNEGTFLNFRGAVTDSAPEGLDLKKIAAAALAEDAVPRNPEFEEKHPRGNTRTGHKGQFRKSEKTLAKLDEADAAAGQIRTDGGEVPETLTDKEMADLEAHFGTTEDIKAAGWLLPNGSLLDFNRDYHDPEKSDWVEHGEIGWYLSDERKKAAGISEESRKKDLDALTRGRESASRAGAIRFDNYPQGLSIDIYREPSAAQYQQLEVLAHHNWWQDMDGGHVVDFGNGQTMTYPDNETLAKRLVADVKRHFSGSDENADAYAVRMFHSTEDASPMNLKKIASLALAEDAAIVNFDKVGKWVAFPHSRNRDKVAQITESLYDSDIGSPCFVYKGDHGAYRMKQNQVDSFFDSREEAEKFYEQENAKPSDISKYATSTHAEDAAAKTKHRFKAGDSVQLPVKHWPKSLPGEMGDVREVDEEKGVYLVEFDETGTTDPIPFSCLDEYGIKYIDGARVEDAAPKSFDIYKDFDQNLFEWGAIREINRIRRAVAAKPKDSVVTDEEFMELNQPFYEAAKKYIADNGFSPDKQWVKDTVLSVPKALANAFDTLSDGEGVSREHFLEVLTVEAICALAIGAVDSVRTIEDYYGKHKFKRDSDGDVLSHAPDFETPVTVEDASDSVDMLLTSDLHTTDLDTLDPKDARIVVIAGDIMGGGMDSDDAGREYLEKKFFPWCREHADKDIVVTAGNHDKFLFRQWVKGKKLNWPENVHYLVDKGETIGGLKFYGTPWCLKNRPGRFEGTEETLKEYFSKMPKNLDVLISHSPPYIPGEKIDDRGDGLHEGSKELTEAILEKKPRLVVCGHVHSGSRKPAELGDSKVMNVSRVDHDRSEEAHRPHVIHFHAKKGTD